MFRLFFTFVLVLILRCLTNAQNESTNKVSANSTQQNQCEKSSSKECCNCRDGRDGKDGRDGRDGRNGLKGEKGELGISQGNCGINGTKGEKGEHGSRGNDGINGTKGIKGEQGLRGNDGINGTKGLKGEQGLQGKDGMNGTKGQKGEPGLSAKPPHGAFQFGDAAENCTLGTAGTVRFSSSKNALEVCDGSAWLPLLTAWKGHVASNPGRHCLDILNSGQSHGNGLYWIDPNGGSKNDSFQAFCDMATEGGGWTLVATKVSPGFLFIKTSFSTMAAKTKNADAASHIHPAMGDWEEVMFRFADVNTIRVIYNRKASAPKYGHYVNTRFERFLMGKSSSFSSFILSVGKVHGFYKYSPADQNKRCPAVGYATISSLNFYASYGISEPSRGGGTLKWLNMWYRASIHSNKYVTSDDSRALRTKCIAGYCYLNKPIWVMVR